MINTIALMLGLLLAWQVHAQSLTDAFAKAWARQPLAQAGAAREAELAARAEAAASPTPGPAALSLSNLNDRLGTGRGKDEWEVEVALPLWLPGQKAARRAEASSAQDELSARRDAQRLQLAGELREAWWALAQARNAAALAQRRIATVRALEADVLRRYKVGELARIDANLAQSERLAAESDLAEAEAASRLAEQAYRNLTGSPAPALLAAETPVATDSAQAHPMGNSRHPSLAAAAANAQLARTRLALAAQSQREAPTLALRALRERADVAEPYSNAIGVKLTIPFSFGPRVRQDNAAARADVAQAEAEMDALQQKLAQDQERAQQDQDSAERQLAGAEQRHALAADSLQLAEKSFRLGESGLAALLQARSAAFDAQAALSRQQTVLAASRSRLKQSMGVLP